MHPSPRTSSVLPSPRRAWVSITGLALGALVWGPGCATPPPPAPPPPPPKVMVLINEKGLDRQPSAEIEALTLPLLMDRKVPVVDRDTVQANLKKIRKLMAANGDEQGATAAGMEFGAEVVIQGAAEVKRTASRIGGSNLQTYQGVVNLRAICTDDGSLLASVSESKNAIALDDVIGSAKALRSAGNSAVPTLVDSLLAAWETRQKEKAASGDLSAERFDTSVSAALRPPPLEELTLDVATPPASYTPPMAAIWRLAPDVGVNKEWMGPVTESLYAVIMQSRWYRLVTREDMQKLLAEHNIQMSDLCDSTEEAVQYGKILSARKIIIGNVSKLGPTFQVVLKLVDVESGEIEKVGQASGRGSPDILFQLAKKAAAELIQHRAGPAPPPDDAADDLPAK